MSSARKENSHEYLGVNVPARFNRIFQVTGLLFILASCGPSGQDIYVSHVNETMGKFVTAEADYNRGIEDITEEFRDSGEVPSKGV